ncbi:MAG: UDP-N-acetylmuramoyl-L-alanine--D-glutamate ligase [Gammaproteobacteria bacterium]|nr:UDP-N-acetylmuramoyl-L-alanine--D-glutamate ligase [Gammaproteobacteria bacterium]
MTDNNRNAVVVGLGATGLSCVRYLHARGYSVSVVDSRELPPALARLKQEYADVEFRGGEFRTEWFDAADMLVVSPGVSIRQPVIEQARARGADIVGDIELFAREVKAPVIAITGSNGKSTVTSLVGELCRGAGMNAPVGGNIGRPVLEMLDEPEADVYVLELSSFQLETTASLAAASAVVLNISEDHMDRYNDLDDYADSKAIIYRQCGHVVYNREDSVVAAMAVGYAGARSFGFDRPRRAEDYGIDESSEWIVRGNEQVARIADIGLVGNHNMTNVMAALSLVEPFAIPVDVVRTVLKSFTGLRHRSELVAESGGVKWINDSKATNVGAAIAALQGLSGPVILIAGGEGKDADFRPFGVAMPGRVKLLVLIGRDAQIIRDAVPGSVASVTADSMEQAVQIAGDNAEAGDYVLLSPACASFDMFRNFEHRGDVFGECVRAYLGQGAAG